MTVKNAHMRSVNSDPLSEREADLVLAAALIQGNKAAQQKLVKRVFDVVVSTVSYALNNCAFADDAVQDSLMEILKSMKYFRGECSLETWARKIAIRTASRHVRKQRRRNALLFFLPRPPEMELPQAEEHVSKRELRLHLNTLVAKLPEKQQVAIRLRFVNELSLKEISQIVNAPQETVRDRIKTGKKKLRKIIADNPAFEGWLTKGIV